MSLNELPRRVNERSGERFPPKGRVKSSLFLFSPLFSFSVPPFQHSTAFRPLYFFKLQNIEMESLSELFIGIYISLNTLVRIMYARIIFTHEYAFLHLSTY